MIVVILLDLRLLLLLLLDFGDSFFVLNHCAIVLILLEQDSRALFVDLGSTEFSVDATDLSVVQHLQKLFEFVDILMELEFELVGERGAFFVADGLLQEFGLQVQRFEFKLVD